MKRTNGIIIKKCRLSGGFTLFELLVVTAIMIALLALTVPVLTSMAAGKRVESGAQIVQSMLVAARQYATEYNCYCAVRFSKPTGDDVLLGGTKLDLFYADDGSKFASGAGTPVPNSPPEELPEQTVVAKGIPATLSLANVWTMYNDIAVTPETFYVYFAPNGQLDWNSEFKLTVLLQAEGMATDYLTYVINRNTGSALRFD